MASEQNHINRMQEWLQAHCPVNNCKLLWRDEHEDVGGCFRVRIILVNTGTSSDKDMQMPWSDAFVRRMDAKKDAARLCLQSLLRAQLFPHDPTKVPLAVALIGVGGGGGDEGDRSSAPGPELILPDLAPNNPFGLLSVDPVIMTPVPTGGAGQILDDHSEDDEDDKADLRRMTAIKSSSSTAPVSAAPQSLPPANLGKLGEQYALAWLAAQPWVVPGSLRWENTSAQAATRDITCLPKGSPGRAHIEVKTRWRRFRKAGASRAQRERLLDPEDDYMLLILGFFENMYPSDDTPPKPPCIRILPNVKWEDQTVTCVWCDHAFAWSVAEQQASGAVRPNMDKPPELCAPCLSKLKCKRTGGELRKCVSCHKTWVYEVGEQRFLEKKGYSDPKRCKPCRAQAREGKKNATDKTPVEMLILDEEMLISTSFPPWPGTGRRLRTTPEKDVENGSMPPPSKVLQAKRPAALAVADPASTPSSQPPAPAEPEVFSGKFAGKVKLSRDLGKKYSLRVMKLLQHDQKYIEMEENRPELKSQIETFRRLLEEAAELDASKEPVTSKEPVKSEEPKASATPKPPTLVRPLSLWKLRFREKKKPRPVLKEGERQTYDINFILKFQGLCNEAASLAADWSQVVATYARTHADAHAQRQADMGRYEEALVEMQEALDLEIKFLGSEHSSLADSYRDIGKLHMLQGKYEEALEMFEKSLEIDTQVLGSNNHPDIVLTKEFMGQVWKEMGKTSEAQVGGPLTRIDAIEQKFTEAADIRRKELTMRRIEQDDLEQW